MMKYRYLVFVILTFLFNLFFWYYMIVFCSVYVVTSRTWLISGMQALAIDWFVFEFIEPLGVVAIRVICKRFKSLM
jgi:hypothetical protein